MYAHLKSATVCLAGCLIFSAGCLAVAPAPNVEPAGVPTMAPLIVATMETDTPTATPSVTPVPPMETPTSVPPTATSTSTPVPPTATATRRQATATPSPKPVVQPTNTPAATDPQPATAAQQSPLPAATDLSREEAKTLGLLNSERGRAGLQLLIVDPVLLSVARARATDMITRGFYSHFDPVSGERAAKAMLARLGVTMIASENFYSTRPYNDGFVLRAMTWFMSDPPHRNNIMLPQWNRVGVGVAASASGIGVVTQEFGLK